MLLLEELTCMLLLYYYRCNIIQEIHDGQQYLNQVAVGQDLLHPYQRNYVHKEHTILLPLITQEGIKKS